MTHNLGMTGKPTLNMLLEQAQQAAKELQDELDRTKKPKLKYPFYKAQGCFIYRVYEWGQETIAEYSKPALATDAVRVLNADKD